MEEDKCIDWLARLDIPIEETTTRERLTKYLQEQFPTYSDAQLEALAEASGTESALEAAGIKQVRIYYPWGVELRYGIQGMPGLWGWETAKTVLEEEEW